MAGMPWTALGAVSPRVRWQAAHAVVLLLKLGDSNVLLELAKFADGAYSSEAFRDARFLPYELHSRMWLLLAVERCSSEEHASNLESLVPWLVSVARGPSHAVNQVLAQNTL